MQSRQGEQNRMYEGSVGPILSIRGVPPGWGLNIVNFEGGGGVLSARHAAATRQQRAAPSQLQLRWP
jgi:hypothetical protein